MILSLDDTDGSLDRSNEEKEREKDIEIARNNSELSSVQETCDKAMERKVKMENISQKLLSKLDAQSTEMREQKARDLAEIRRLTDEVNELERSLEIAEKDAEQAPFHAIPTRFNAISTLLVFQRRLTPFQR